MLKISPGYGIFEVLVGPDSFLSDATLREVRLKDRHIQVLKVDRGSGTVDFPDADFLIQEGDVLIVYGQIKSIKELVITGQKQPA